MFLIKMLLGKSLRIALLKFAYCDKLADNLLPAITVLKEASSGKFGTGELWESIRLWLGNFPRGIASFRFEIACLFATVSSSTT